VHCYQPVTGSFRRPAGKQHFAVKSNLVRRSHSETLSLLSRLNVRRRSECCSLSTVSPAMAMSAVESGEAVAVAGGEDSPVFESGFDINIFLRRMRSLVKPFEKTCGRVPRRPATARSRWSATDQRRGQSRAAALGSRVRSPLRRRSDPGQQRQDPTSPAQPRRRPRREQRPLHRDTEPAALRPAHPPLRRPPYRRRPEQARDHPLPQRYLAREIYQVLVTAPRPRRPSTLIDRSGLGQP
jgi:hypothetical protein